MILGIDEPAIQADIPRHYHIPNIPPTSPFSPNHDLLATPTNLNSSSISPLLSPMFAWQYPPGQTPPFGVVQKPQFMYNVMQQSTNSSGFQSFQSETKADTSLLSSISSNSSNYVPSPRGSLSPQNEIPTTSDYQSMNEKKTSSFDYENKRLAGFKAMQARPNPGVYRIPTSGWAGYGISHTSPAGFVHTYLKHFEKKKNKYENVSTYKSNYYFRMLKKDEDIWKSPEAFPSTSGFHNTSNILDHTPTHLINRVTTNQWSDLPSLLNSLDLDRYVSLFVQQEVDLPTFATLSDKDLMTIGVTAFGSRRKMLLAISELNKRTRSFSAAPGAERKTSSTNSPPSHDNSPRENW